MLHTNRRVEKNEWARRLLGTFAFSFLIACKTTVPMVAQTLPADPAALGLELLFDAELHAWGDVKPYVTSDTRSPGFSMGRHLIAQGEGSFRGPQLRGTLDWSKLGRKSEEQVHSNTLVVGWLETEDGAEIMYEAKGYAVPLDAANPDKWWYVATLRFEEADEPYEWLENTIALWVGLFDVSTGDAYYRAYVATGKPVTNR